MQVLTGSFSPSEGLRTLVTIGSIMLIEAIMWKWLAKMLTTTHLSRVAVAIARSLTVARAMVTTAAIVVGSLIALASFGVPGVSRVIEDYLAGGLFNPLLAIVVGIVSLLVMVSVGIVALRQYRKDDAVVFVTPVEVQVAVEELQARQEFPTVIEVRDLGEAAARVLKAPASVASHEGLGDVLIGAALVALERRKDQGHLLMTTISLEALGRSWNWGLWADRARVSVVSSPFGDHYSFRLMVSRRRETAIWKVTMRADGTLVSVRNL